MTAFMSLAALKGRRPPSWWRIAALRPALLLAFVTGCHGADAGTADRSPDAGARIKERTVRIELLRVVERVLKTQADGAVTYPEATPLGGVEVCITERRAAFAVLKPFEALDPKLCTTNTAGEPVRLANVPANSDLLITYEKAGYRTVVSTFRTDEYDIASPSWADNDTYFTPLLRLDAAPLLSATGLNEGTDGLIAVWAGANGQYGIGASGTAQLIAESDKGVTQSDGVHVKISAADGGHVTELDTRRDRPLFLWLPEGSYTLQFTHPIMELLPFGVLEQFTIAGLPTDAKDTVEVAVMRGDLTLATMDGYCPLPNNPAQQFKDLATCTLEASVDAGTP
jgi:hypothetical protein